MAVPGTQGKHNIAHLHWATRRNQIDWRQHSLLKPHTQPEMVVHPRETGVARPCSYDQVTDERRHTVVSWQIDLSSIDGLHVPRTPLAIFQKCLMHNLAQHMFHGASNSMLGTILPCQIQNPIRTS